jgi:hypothetical protein
MREASPQDAAAAAAAARAHSRALAISVLWMLAVQLTCVVLWDGGSLTRHGALVHWLLVGVLPPALALWVSQKPAEPAD